MTIREAQERIKNKETSAEEMVNYYLEKEDKVNAFLVKNKKARPGIPIAIKDNILVKGMKCTAGSRILENYIASYDATVIEKLKKAGFTTIGKTNLDEFAMGSSTENSAYKLTKNPHNFQRVPGGSSGGSAAAVAADLCVAALGSDTGGSIRQPACFCGVVGLKPTYGAVSRYGLIAMASSLDQIGPITKTVEDCKILFDIIRGKDDLDSTSVKFEKKFENWKLASVEDESPKEKIGNLKIGIPNEYFVEGIEPGVDKTIRKAILDLEKLGAKISGCSLPHTKYALSCYYIIMPAEASANLARYDGIRYGFERDKFGAEVKRRIMLGTYTLSAGYYDAYYLKAQKVRTLIKNDFANVFKKFDLLVTPTSPTTAFKIGEKIADPLTMYLSDVYTVPINLAGLPAISIPCGKAEDLPVGLQIIGPYFSEDLILNTAHIYESTHF